MAISSDTEERNTSATQPSADVTVASNLPTGDAANSAQGKSNSTETRERLNYEVSETQREVLKTPGALRRVSVAVLVDGEQNVAADGTVSWQPRSEDELAVLRDLVKTAAGLDEARGDVLVLKSLAFEPMPESGTMAEAGLFSGIDGLDTMSLIQAVVLALVALILGLFVVRPLLLSKTRDLATDTASVNSLPVPNSKTVASGQIPNTNRILTGEIEDHDLPDLPVVSYDEPDVRGQDPVDRLRRLINERQGETVEILRGWMETDEEEQA